MSSLRSLGFRMDGIVGPNGINVHADYFASISDRADVVREVRRYFEYLELDGSTNQAHSSQAKRHIAELDLRARLASELVEQLIIQRDRCIRSDFVARNEFIGASLLIVIDATVPHVAVRLIDLAKTCRVPDGI